MMQSHTNEHVEQTPLDNGINYDGRQYQTIDKGNKTLILYTNYININKKYMADNHYSCLISQQNPYQA